VGIADVESAVELIEANPDECWFVGPRDEQLVALAEEALGLRFPPSYRTFLLRLGAGNVGAEEIYGLIDENFVDSTVPNGIWATLRARREWALPNQMVRVYSDGMGGDFVLDTSQMGRDGECPVVAWYPGRSEAGDDLEVIAEDFGAFFLEYARTALD
jgi:antitoxin YobK